MMNQQMELEIAKRTPCRSVNRRANRSPRAAWWFDKMRRVVDHAIDAKPVPAARPQQIWFQE
ncbi:MAG TPA: hypothetical protein VEH04_01625 [Verrucomicrobiae bacterium]|nr:hypothetical protein [Verrucomicrobiae bacterium]